jgi:hypothetical protein
LRVIAQHARMVALHPRLFAASGVYARQI